MASDVIGTGIPFKYYDPTHEYVGNIDDPPPTLDEMRRWRHQIAAGKDLGFVYILGTLDGYFKIGKTNNISRRVKQLAIQLPYPVRTILAADVFNITVAERELHHHFANKRMNGEWFKLQEEDIRFVASYVGYVGESEIEWVRDLMQCEWERRYAEWIYVLALNGNEDARGLLREVKEAKERGQ